MATIKYAPIYDINSLQPIVHSTDLGSHQANELGDGTMTIAENTKDMESYDYQALGAIRLDEMELYRLYMTLEAKFRMGGQQS